MRPVLKGDRVLLTPEKTQDLLINEKVKGAGGE